MKSREFENELRMQVGFTNPLSQPICRFLNSFANLISARLLFHIACCRIFCYNVRRTKHRTRECESYSSAVVAFRHRGVIAGHLLLPALCQCHGSLSGVTSHSLRIKLFDSVMSNIILCTYNIRILYRIFISTACFCLKKKGKCFLIFVADTAAHNLPVSCLSCCH